MSQPMRLLLLLACCCIANSAFAAPSDAEQQKINYLLNAVGTSPLIFIRNGKEYKGPEAQSHLEDKLHNVGNYIHTAEDFIELVAKQSFLTGRPYMVRLEDGTQTTSDAWLHEQLKKYAATQKNADNRQH
jgi:hypothetical protein